MGCRRRFTGLILALSLLATDSFGMSCPQLALRANSPTLKALLERRFMTVMTSEPKVQRAAELISRLGVFEVKSPVSITGESTIKGNTLTVFVDYVGPANFAVPRRNLTPWESMKEAMARQAGYFDPFNQVESLNLNSGRATASVLLAVEKIVAEHPEIEFVTLKAKKVKNYGLRQMLTNRFGFVTTRTGSSSLSSAPGIETDQELTLTLNAAEPSLP